MTYLIFYHIKFLDFKKIILKTLGAKCSTSELCFSTGALPTSKVKMKAH